MYKKCLSLIMIWTMMCSMIASAPMIAHAVEAPAGPVSLDIAAGSIVIKADAYDFGTSANIVNSSNSYIITQSSPDTPTTNTITVQDNADVSITLENINISTSTCAFGISAGSHVDLTLSGANYLQSGLNRAGLEVPEGAELVVSGTSDDTLNVIGGDYAAGIGGGKSSSGGNIIIEGGVIDAAGGNAAGGTGSGAGIGGGRGGSGGTITIIGGEITAAGGYRAAGIGGGTGGSSGIILIQDGDVSAAAAASSYSAGIGGGYNGKLDSITIEGGTIAASGDDGAGIGGGRMQNTPPTTDGGTINISGGTITAQSINGPGIGGCYLLYLTYNMPTTLNISGGIITADSISHAGICSNEGTINISDGDISAVSHNYGAGIGGSYGRTNGGTINISGGTIVAQGGSTGGAGIGGGYYGDAVDAAGSTINISGGDITAAGGQYSAGIGGGYGTTAGEITITGGNINANGNGGSAIGIGVVGWPGTGGGGNIIISQALVNVSVENTLDTAAINAGPSGSIHIGFTGEPSEWVCDPIDDRAEITFVDSGFSPDGLILGTCLIEGAGDMDGSYIEGVKQLADDNTAPVLTAGTVSRISDTEATVKFTSDEAGTYYYSVSASESAPDGSEIVAGGIEGTAVTADSVVSFSPAGLTAGVRYVHIAIKDSSDNISNVLTAGMPYDYYYKEDFEVYPIDTTIASGALAPISQLHNGTGDASQKVAAAVNSSSAKMLSLSSTSSNASDQVVNLDSDVLAAAGSYVFEGDVYPLGTDGWQLRFSFTDGSYEGAHEAGVFFNSGKITTATRSGSVELKDTFTANQWYHVKILVTPSANKYAVYVDSVLLNDSLPLPSGIKRLAITSGHGKTAYYDNLKFYTAPAPLADSTAPVLTAGTVSRISDTEATVKFTSDEAGEYYYEVVSTGSPQPDIDTSGSGTACDTTEQTISLDSLTAGAKYIYIVVKDAAGNESVPLFMDIAAYSAPAPGTIQFTASGYGTYEGYNGWEYVQRSGGSDGVVTVDYATVDDTAIAGVHYAAKSGTLTWNDGDTANKAFPVNIYNDSTYNGYLNFSYVLSNPTGGAVIGEQNPLNVKLSDNDIPPVPAGLKAKAGNKKVDLSWDPVNSAYYKLYYSTVSGEFTEDNSISVYDGVTYTMTELKNGTTYYFAIKAGHNIYFSDLSDTVSATPRASGGGGGGSYTPPVKEEPAVEEPVEEPVITETELPVLNDISGHWAQKYIEHLVKKGAIAGYPDQSFRPDATITRAEFAVVLVKAFDLQAESGKIFGDTAGHWAKDYIATAAANGIILGYNDLEFGPDDLITREQMAIMIVKAAKLKSGSEKADFIDKTDVSAWALDWVAAAIQNNMMTGYPDNSFKPQEMASRAEAVTVIFNALK